MCQSYVFGDREIGTVAAVRALFGADSFVWYDGESGIDLSKPDDELDFCVCGLDMEETARRAGYEARNDHGGDPMQYRLVKL